MRVITASILVGSLMIGGSMPNAFAQVAPATPAHSVSKGDVKADRDSYTEKARTDVQIWREKLDRFDEKAKARGQTVVSASERDLNTAWTKTASAARKLQTMGAAGWEDTKISYEKASRRLADAWDRIRPGDK